MSYTISTTNITATSVDVVLTLTSDYSEADTVTLTVKKGTATVSTDTASITVGAQTGDEITTTFTDLRSNTAYTVTDGTLTESFTTAQDTTPKTATQSQWEDLADKVNSKVEVGAVVSQPSSVAYVEEDNIVDGSVTSDKLAANSVTSSKIDSTTFFYEADSVAPVSVDTTFVTLKTVTVTKKGNYAIFVRITQSGAVAASNGAVVYVDIDKNGTQLYEVVGNTCANYAGNAFAGTDLVYGFTANAGDQIEIKVSKNRSNFTSNLGCNYVVMQVA